MGCESGFIPEMLIAEKQGVSFLQCLNACIENKELIANYDRLNGTNLSLKGSSLEKHIDASTGRQKSELKDFINFVWEYIFTRF